MRYLILALILAAPMTAGAGEILRLPESGQYRFNARAGEAAFDPADLTGTSEICAFLGGTQLACWPVDAQGEVNQLMTLVFDGQDKQIFGRARDASGNESVDSVDNYLIDETKPSGPVLISEMPLDSDLVGCTDHGTAPDVS